MKVIFTRGIAKESEYKKFKNYLTESSNRENVCKNLLKTEVARLIQPILKGTGLSNLEITNILIDDIDLGVYKSINNTSSNIVLIKLVFNALYRIAIEATSITNKDYAEYLNSIYDEVVEICDNIVYLLNCK